MAKTFRRLAPASPNLSVEIDTDLPFEDPADMERPISPHNSDLFPVLSKMPGLEKYVSILEKHEIDAISFVLLSEEDLKEMEVPIGPRKKMMFIIKKLSKREEKKKRQQKIIKQMMQAGCFNWFSSLPAEVILYIFGWFSARELCAISSTCKRWRELSRDDILWKMLYFSRWKSAKRGAISSSLVPALPLPALSSAPPAFAPAGPAGMTPRGQSAMNIAGGNAAASASAAVAAANSTPYVPIVSKKSWKELYAERCHVNKNWKTGKFSVSQFGGQQALVMCLQFEGNTLATGSEHNIRVYDIASKECLRTLSVGAFEDTGPVNCLHLHGNHVVSGYQVPDIRLWNVAKGQCVRVFKGHTKEVRSVQGIYEQNKMISGSFDRTLKIWDVESGLCQSTLVGHTWYMCSLQYDEASRRMVSTSSEIKVWDFNSGECTHTLVSPEQELFYCLQFSGNLLVTGSSNKTLKVWDMRKGECLRVLRGHNGLINCLQFDEEKLVSGSSDGTVKVWNLQTGECAATLANSLRTVRCLQYDVSRLFLGSFNGTTQLWDFSGV